MLVWCVRSVADMTWLDKYVLASNVFIVAILLQVAVSAHSTSHGTDTLSFGSSDFSDASIMLFINGGVWVLWQIVVCIHVICTVLPAERAKLSMSSVQLASKFRKKKSTRMGKYNLVVDASAFEAINLRELATVRKNKHPDTTDDPSRGINGADNSKGEGGGEISIYRGNAQTPWDGGGYTNVRGGAKVGDLGAANNTHPLAGVYKADYGHGIETVVFSVICDEKQKKRLVGRKITGDPNVPAGRLSHVVDAVPEVGGPAIPGRVQVRYKKDDTDAFFGKDTLVAASEDGTRTGRSVFRYRAGKKNMCSRDLGNKHREATHAYGRMLMVQSSGTWSRRYQRLRHQGPVEPRYRAPCVERNWGEGELLQIIRGTRITSVQ